jgi:hypothetical protein
MPDWQITATTISCPDVDDEVTVLISGDGAVKCTGWQKYTRPDKEAAKAMKKKSRQSGRALSCLGAECRRLKECRDKWLSL